MEAPAHVGYIAAAYGLTALAIAGLVIRAVVDARIQRRRLAAIEKRGARPGRDVASTRARTLPAADERSRAS